MRKMRVFLLFLIVVSVRLAVHADTSAYSISYHSSAYQINVQNFQKMDFRSLTDHRKLRGNGDKGYYLFRITLNSPPPTDGYLLFIENEHLDSVFLYKRKGDSLVLTTRAGNSFPESVNRFGLPQFRLDGTSKEYYLLTKFEHDASFNFKIDSVWDMNRWSTIVFFKLGLYYGFSFMFFVLNLFLFVYLRDRIFLYYCLFQFFIVSSIAYADGLFPFICSWPWLLKQAEIPLHTGLAFSGCVFALAFLEKKKRSLTARVSLAFLLMLSVTYVLSIIYRSHALFLAAECLVMLLLCFFWVVAAQQFNRHIHSRFFVIGYGVFLVFAIDYFLLRKLDIYVLDFYMGQLKTGSLIEMLVLSVAIVVRMTALRDENLHYRHTIERYMQLLRESTAKETTKAIDIFETMRQTYGLTDREVEVLRGISEGLTNNQIAEKVFLSIHTVKFHTRNIFEKLNIRNRTQALGKLRELGG